MSASKTKESLIFHKEKALECLNTYLDSLIGSPDEPTRKKADKLSYWFEDYARQLNKEKTFNPTKYIKYQRGDIVKVHLGYRIGNEEGGLHFGIVLDANNAKSSGTITIIPLTSLKEGKKIRHSSVALGPELFRLIISKHTRLSEEINARLNRIEELIHGTENDKLEEFVQTLSDEEINHLEAECKSLQKKRDELKEIRKSIIRMKNGSVALVDQITTVSKIRIYDPVYSNNVLYGIRLSDASLDLIDEKIRELFFKK